MPGERVETQELSHRLAGAFPQLFVSDVERSAQYCSQVLGFRIVYLHGEPPFYGQVSRDEAHLNLRHVDAAVVDPETRDRENLLSAYIPVSGVRRLYSEVMGRGAAFHQGLLEQAWGTLDFIVRDPDGNLLCFAESTSEAS